MYSKYFGLKEPSFSITPDPQYLFLSEQHREALAHLLFGAGESGGFVLLSGEVGTGKTTVCRAFLEQLPEDVDVALILNPAMTVTELLRAVCEEFRIKLGEDDRTVKRLVDRLNSYLLEAHARGRRSVVLIDEAQNLKPRVLEQVRLLTNLETTKQKLLQIFLVGQPELRTLLQSEGLRQLNQRITARYHLRPFSARETADYVRHRLAVAGVERRLFTRGALRHIHRLSAGIPRLINILCDRALLGACVTRSAFVTRRIVDKAAHEVRDDVAWPRYVPSVGKALLAAAVLLASIAVGWATQAWLFGQDLPPLPPMIARWLPEDMRTPALDQVVEAKEAASPIAAATAAAVVATVEEPKLPPVDISTLLLDRAAAMRVLLRRWGVELGDVEGTDPCAKLTTFGLRCEQGVGDWTELRACDRPALLLMFDESGAENYLALGELQGEQATFDVLDGSQQVALSQLDQVWEGDYLLVWQPPPMGSGVIGHSASREAVRWLRKLLSQVPGLGVNDSGSGVFDRGLEDAVRRFQEQQGIAVDGIAGSRTLIRLHNAVAMPGIPRLTAEP